MVTGLDGDEPCTVTVRRLGNAARFDSAAAPAAAARRALRPAGGRLDDALVLPVVSERVHALRADLGAVLAHIGRHAAFRAGGRDGLAVNLIPVVPRRLLGDLRDVFSALAAFENVVAVLRTGRLAHVDLLVIVLAVFVFVPAVRLRRGLRADGDQQHSAAEQAKRSLHLSSPLYDRWILHHSQRSFRSNPYSSISFSKKSLIAEAFSL